ncbi:hypothetical protein L2E82_50083 [Cichorium intybus]|nr:hypothetical protein L2E82_50083 [Cichorium intybus]
MNYSDVRYLASKMWSIHGLQDVLLNGKGVYLFKFSDDNGLHHVITHGPWTFKGVPIGMQKWHPDLNIHKNNHDKLPLWIKIHDIPYEAWSDDGLSHIASKIEKPLAMDSYTANMCKYAAGKSVYAHVLLEIPTKSSWVDKVIIRIPDPDTLEFYTHTLRIEYEWKPPICSHCMVFGHETKNCMHVISKTNEDNPKDKMPLDHGIVTTPMQLDDGFTVVYKKKNRSKQGSNSENTTNDILQSNSNRNTKGIRKGKDSSINKIWNKSKSSINKTRFEFRPPYPSSFFFHAT